MTSANDNKNFLVWDLVYVNKARRRVCDVDLTRFQFRIQNPASSLHFVSRTMRLSTVFPAVLVTLSWFFVAAAQDAVKTTVGGGNAAVAKPNSTELNTTNGDAKSGSGLFHSLNMDSSMIQRALYVLIGITVIGVLYFLVRAVRLKKPVQRKKYGLLSNYEDSVEMMAVESDEDDTLYEARSLRRSAATFIVTCF
ncbi:protein FAM174C [Neosynchiropus ocellatus]